MMNVFVANVSRSWCTVVTYQVTILMWRTSYQRNTAQCTVAVSVTETEEKAGSESLFKCVH